MWRIHTKTEWFQWWCQSLLSKPLSAWVWWPPSTRVDLPPPTPPLRAPSRLYYSTTGGSFTVGRGRPSKHHPPPGFAKIPPRQTLFAAGLSQTRPSHGRSQRERVIVWKPVGLKSWEDLRADQWPDWLDWCDLKARECENQLELCWSTFAQLERICVKPDNAGRKSSASVRIAAIFRKMWLLLMLAAGELARIHVGRFNVSGIFWERLKWE